MDSMEDEFVRKLELRRIPVFATSEEAMKVLGALLTYQRWLLKGPEEGE